MSVVVEFADGVHGNALEDFNRCHEDADASQSSMLDNLLFDHVADTLGGMSSKKLAAYVGSRKHWRMEQGHPVLRTSGPPYVAYAVFNRGGVDVVLVLGFCLAIPNSDDLWWTQVLQPRLIEHL